MNNILYDFLKQTIEKFDFQKKTQMNYIFVDRILIKADGKEIKSYARDFNYKCRNVLETIIFEKAHISSFEQLNEEFIDILKTPNFSNWVKDKLSYLNLRHFDIFLSYATPNRKGSYNIGDCSLIEIDDGSISIDYYRNEISTLKELISYIIKGHHHLQIIDVGLISSCLIADVHKSKENICSHYGIDQKKLENEYWECYPLKQHITVEGNNHRMFNVVVTIGSCKEAVEIINALNHLNARMEVEQNGRIDIIKK